MESKPRGKAARGRSRGHAPSAAQLTAAVREAEIARAGWRLSARARHLKGITVDFAVSAAKKILFPTQDHLGPAGACIPSRGRRSERRVHLPLRAGKHSPDHHLEDGLRDRAADHRGERSVGAPFPPQTPPHRILPSQHCDPPASCPGERTGSLPISGRERSRRGPPLEDRGLEARRGTYGTAYQTSTPGTKRLSRYCQREVTALGAAGSPADH